MKTSIAITIAGSTTVMLVVLVVTLMVVLNPSGEPKDYRQFILDNVNIENINSFLSDLTLEPHPAGSARDKEVASVIQSVWNLQGLQNVGIISYKVLLTNANPKIANKVVIMNSLNETIYESSSSQPLIPDAPAVDQEKIHSFCAFSGMGIVKSSEVVYANYGTKDDFQVLASENISVNNSIVIIRYGNIFRGDKVRFAESLGATAVILYSDPADVAPKGPLDTYPASQYAPPGATQLGSLRLQGDLLTPGYPATEWALRLSEAEADLASIPVQPVGYGDAWYFLNILEGQEAPPAWQGGLNFTYHLGPVVADEATISVTASNVYNFDTVYNVVGQFDGKEEPDRYVLVGNHYDAWTYGGSDPSSATAVMTELVRIFGVMYSDGWRPRRTLVFCSWAAEEQGLIGSTEFAEQYSATLKDRAVAYLNLDMVITGNYSFRGMGVPMFHDVMIDAAKKVPNPDPAEVSAGRATLYDTWLERHPDEAFSGTRPKFGPISSRSDFRAYLFNLGIPSMDMEFTSDPEHPELPLLHTAYETCFLTTELLDRGLLYHQAMTRMLGLLAFEFSSQPLLPYNVEAYVEFISSSWSDFLQSHGEELTALGVNNTGFLGTSVQNLLAAGKTFAANQAAADLSDPLTVRRYNDAMLLLDKALLAPHGLPERPLLNHVFVAPSSLNGYTWDTFPGLRDLLNDPREASTTGRLLREHVAALTHHFTLATQALRFDLW